MATEEKNIILDELSKLEILISKFGQMETMMRIGYVSVMPIYYWRKSKNIPHWAKARINKLFEEQEQ